ncbi:MAG: histidine--tRNA ligase [Microthrixaceae bacterium]
MSAERPEKFQSLTGMRDVLWPDSARHRALVDAFANTAELAGYRELVLPLVEDLGVFLRVGEATDVVTKEMYDFTDRDGTRIALRPEMTAGVARAFVQHKPLVPWKVFYAGSNFRHERPQKGRYRAFEQVGLEALGSDDPDLDVEVIVLAWRFFESIGLREVKLLLNTLGDHDERARYGHAVEQHLRSHSEELSESSVETLERNPLRVLDSKRREDRAVISTAPSISEFLGPESGEHFSRVKEGLESLEVPFTVDERLVRGLDYYRRTTFEFAAVALDAAQNAIGGGGRYDRLVEDLGGPPTDGIGFALGVDRILLAADAEGVFDKPQPYLDAFVVDMTGGQQARALTHELRSAGFGADRRFGGGSMKAQMKAADRSGAAVAVIVGEEELAAGELTIRALRHHSDTAGDAAQRRVQRTDLISSISEYATAERPTTTP